MKFKNHTWWGGVLALVVVFLSHALPLAAATVTWVGGSGDWNTTNNWSTGALPGTNDDVVIASGPSITVTHSTGSHTVRSVQSQQAFVLSGGSLTVSNTFQDSNTFSLAGGTLANATVVMTNGIPLVVSNATVNGVTVNGVLDVGNSVNGAHLTVLGGLTLNGTALVGNPTNGNSGYGYLVFTGTQTLGGSGTVMFGDSPNYDSLLLGSAATALTIGPGITIEGQTGWLGYDPSLGGVQNGTIISQGVISANVSGGTITIYGQPFNNQGLTEALNGGTLTLDNTWSNTGTLVESGGVLNLNGNMTTAGLGTINRTNGTVNLTGTLNNTNGTLTLNAASGSWVLNGGDIQGGAITETGTNELVVSSGTLDGVTVNGVLDVGASVNGAHVTVLDGLTLNGTALVGNPTNGNSGYGYLVFTGTQTLGGSGTVMFGDSPNYDSLLLGSAATALTIGPGITIEGQTGWLGYDPSLGGVQNGTIISQGVISANVSGGTITIYGQPFNNQGLTEALNGGTLTLDNTWSNTGTLVESGGVLNLNGNMTTAGLGTINRTNGTVNLTGTLNNTNGTLTLNAASGSWVLNGGDIQGGAITETGTNELVVSSGTLNGVTVNGVLDVGNSVNGAHLTVLGGLTLNGTALVGNPTNGNSGYGYLVFTGTQTLGGSGTVMFGDSPNYDSLLLGSAATALTIGPGITIEGQTGWLGYDPSLGGVQNGTIINQGVISADVSGGTITIYAQPFNNQGLAQGINGGSLSIYGLQNGVGGTVTFTGGGTLALNGSWTNAGTVNATNTTVNLGGTFTTANLGTFNRSGGTVNLTGTLNNTNGTLTLNAASGSWVLNGGTVQGGAITETGTNELVINSGTLNGVTFNGTLDVGNSVNGAILTVLNGLTLNGTALVGNPTNSNYGYVSFNGTQTLGGSGTVMFGESPYYNALLLANSTTALTIGPGIAIEGNGWLGYSPYLGGVQTGTIINQGVISANVSGGTITIYAQPLVNSGTVAMSNGGSLNLDYLASVVGLSVSGGGTLMLNGNWQLNQTLAVNGGTLNFSGSWTNAGTVNATNTTVNLGGTFATTNLGTFNRSGGTLNLTGTLNNTNGTLTLNAASGSWVLNGGTVQGGAITETGTNELVINSGTLNGVTFNGTLDVGASVTGAILTVLNGLTLNGTALVGNPTNSNYGYVSFNGTQTLGGSGTVVFGESPYYNGLLLANSATALTIGPGITIEGQNGWLGYSPYLGGAQNGTILNQGVISANVSGGTITIYAQPLSNVGTLSAPIGTLTVNGSCNLAGGNVAVGISGVSSFGQINFAGAISFAGTFGISLNNGYQPGLGNTFALINYGSENGSFSSYNFPVSTLPLQLNYGLGSLTVMPVQQLVPIVNIISPTNNSAYQTPVNITIDATATSLSGTITKVDFFHGTTHLGTASNSPYNLIWTNVPPGAYALYATATDATGAVGASSAKIITVIPTVTGTNFTWVGSVSSDWFTAGNWSPAGVPGALDEASINSGTASLSHSTTIGFVNLAAGTINGAGLLSVSNTFYWTGGSVYCPVMIQTNSQMIIAGSAAKSLYGVLTNAGTVDWEGTGYLQLFNYGPDGYTGGIVNLAGAVFNALNDEEIYNWQGLEYFDNAGTFQKSGTTGITTVGVIFTNAGAVDVESGTVDFNVNGSGTGTFNAAANATIGFDGNNSGSAFTGPGDYSVTGGTLALNGTVQNLFVSGGTVNGVNASISNLSWSEGTLGGADTVTGTANWTGGTIGAGGSVTVASNAVLNISGSVAKILYGVLTNAGTVDWGGTGYLQLYNYGPDGYTGGIVNLAGAVFNALNDEEIYNWQGSEYFDNAGAFQKSGTTGITTVGVIFTNAGTLAAESGNISLASTYSLTNGTLDFGLSGPTNFGQLNLSGTAALSGTLGINILNSYVPNLGDTFSLITYGSHGGAFGSLSLSPLAGGKAWQVSYGATAVTLQAVANSNVAAQITGYVQDNQGHAITNINVFAYTTNSSNLYVSSATDASGNYALNVANGNWVVGVQGLVALGYAPVSTQVVTVSNANQVADFVTEPFSGQIFNIMLAVSPAGTGTVSGGGTYPIGSMITVMATPVTTILPYLFAGWTEGGVYVSGNSSYAFTVTGNLQLVANFALPVYTVSASNNPPGAGSVSGTGSFVYGTTNVQTATPNFGYAFSNWTEGASIVGTSPVLTTVVYANHAFSANYAAVNLTHIVTTATSPGGLTVVSGAGTYSNGQAANFSAPPLITNAPDLYTFQDFTLSNSVVSGSASFSKTFSTLDPTNLQYVAVYHGVSILPLIIQAGANYSSPVPATTNFLLTLQFDRSMNTNLAPVVLLTNSAATLQPVIATNGYWTGTALANDTYHVPAITFAPGMDGTNQLFVSGAQDLKGDTLALTNPASYTVEATPPPIPVLSAISSNSSSVTVSWSGYAAPADLVGFRAYIRPTNFSSVTGLTILTGLGSGARSYQFGNLSLDTPYFVAIQAEDTAGNASGISVLQISVPSVIPPAVSIHETPVGANSANLTWSGYNTSGLFGFSGFYVYNQQANFTSVTGLTPVATIAPTATSFQINSLDRTKTNYFAVVGFNYLNGFNPNVVTARWTDPYGGNIGVNTTIGGTTPSVVPIYQNIVVASNATLTIEPGTTLLFAPGTSLTVQSGSLVANGTALAPIIFDSANDTAGNTPAPGDWEGVTLSSGAGSSSLQFVEVLYGGGLTISGCAPVVTAFTGNYNTPYGLGLQNGATLTTSSALLDGNAVGVQQLDTASLVLQNSVIQNNGTNALAGGSFALNAISNWWGTTLPLVVSQSVHGNVSYNPFLNYEPLLTPALGTANGATQVYSQTANLELACRTAISMRISEDNTFTGVFFGPYTNNTVFALSAGSGLKHIFAQFRSVTGQTNVPVELDLNYIVTGGPVIQLFSLTEGETLNRPLTVTGSATASLGVLDMEFYVDGVLQGTNAGASLSQYFDIRTLGNSVHQVELLARDNVGNIATLANNVVIAVTPPLAPVITQPAADIVTNTDVLTIRGTAEPLISVGVYDNGQVLELTNTDASGNFAVTNATLLEGVNPLLAVASDSTGATASATRNVTVETIPPAALVLNAPVYVPGTGLILNWQFAPTGKQATTFELFWSTSPFTSANQATSHSLVLNSIGYTVQGLNNGTYYFGVVGYDAAGNPSPLSTLVSTVYDAIPPALSISYSQPSPVGVGPLNIILTSSKALAATPSLTFQPSGAVSPILLNLTNAALNTYLTTFPVTTTTRSGTVAVMAAAQDLVGNVFNGSPTGPALVIDTTPPAGIITTTPAGPVQTTNSTNVLVSLRLTKLAGSGTTPTLSYAPPVGASVPIALTGNGSNWSGTLPLTSAMGSGVGLFAMSAVDGLGNVGTQILSGGQLEVYNTALPSAPAAPTNLAAVSLPAGKVSLTWNSVSNAQIYRLYREAGTNFTLPGVLDQDNITTNSVTDLPPADGTYSYGVSASRYGSESGISNVVVALSDRTLPAAPTNVLVALAASGVQVTWQEPNGGEAVDHYNIYRNGIRIRTVSGIVPAVDYPPTGTQNYTVGAVDAVGNENLSAPASIQLLVGPVNNLSVVVEIGQTVNLTWVDTDPTVVGYNVYRNGVKQNSLLLTATTYTDPLALSDTVQYAVTAVNGSPAESPPRQVTVSPMGFGLLANPTGTGTNNPLLTGYFDQFQVGITNLSSATTLALTQLQMDRSVNGLSPLNEAQSLAASLGAGTNVQLSVIFPEASVVASQTMQVSAYQQTDSEGSSVVYQDVFTITNVQQPPTEIAVSVNQLPLAGGLTPFQVQIFNRGYADMQLVVSRGNETKPGDLYISVQNNLGQEVSRTPYQGTPPGTIVLPNGDAYVDISAGASLTFAVPDVLVPAALAGSTNVNFEAVVTNIYNQLDMANELVSGPLSGNMVSSSLALPSYYGTAQTDQSVYDNDQPVIISGQAINTVSGLPVPNAALNIGFATRGYKWYQSVTTDTNGNYQYTYNPAPGFGGSLTIWAANPLVVDQLNQVLVEIDRLYATPSAGDIVMSKNGTLNFSVKVFNPGDMPFSAVNTGFAAYQVSGSNLIPLTSITGTNLTGSSLTIGPNQSQTVNLELAAASGAPNSAQVVFTFTSTQGASATFTGTVSLLPAVPILAVNQPAVGYLEVNVNRGDQVSGQITIANSGLASLRGVTLLPPTNDPWMQVNLPVATNGQIQLPDLPPGQTFTFGVVFNPPASTPLAFYQDTVTILATNLSAPFPVGVAAIVTSDLTGAVQFSVEDILGSSLSGASIRLNNSLISASQGPFTTDTNGYCTVSNLTEGTWSWQVSAPGCSAGSGLVTITADQTVSQAVSLNRSLVTINFTVVPVPFSDTYTIAVSENYQTFVPLPVLVVTPPLQTFNNVTPGFQATYTVTVQNQGLVQLTNVTITGQQDNAASYQPLITFIPVLLPQQTVDIPFVVTYTGSSNPSQQQSALSGCLQLGPGGSVPPDLLNALLNGGGTCPLTQNEVNIAANGAVLISPLLDIGPNGGLSGGLEGCVIQGLFQGFSSVYLGLGSGLANPIPNLPSAPSQPQSGPGFSITGGGCLAPETLVLMADGTSKPITEVKTDDLVRSGEHQRNISIVREIRSVFSSDTREIQLTTADGEAVPAVIATIEHLFWVDGAGWIRAADLKPGDWLFNSQGKRLRVMENRQLSGRKEMFTLGLVLDNAFYANNVLVHDGCGPGSLPFDVPMQTAGVRK